MMMRPGTKEGACSWTFGLCRKGKKPWYPEKKFWLPSSDGSGMQGSSDKVVARHQGIRNVSQRKLSPLPRTLSLSLPLSLSHTVGGCLPSLTV